MTERHVDKHLPARRAVLRGGAGVLVLVAGGSVWRGWDQGVFSMGEGPPYRPWTSWREGEGPLALVSAAILAANAHNTQPWLFRVDDSRIGLFADVGRDIGAVDPLRREMHISLGCALENLVLAGRAEGYDCRARLVPERSDPTLVARVDLQPGRREDSALYRAIPERHTNRLPYDTTRPMAKGARRALDGLRRHGEPEIVWFTSATERRDVGDLLVRAAEAINADEEQSRDNLLEWLRHDQDAVRAHRDGLTLTTMGVSSLEAVAGTMLAPPSLRTAEESWLDGMRRQVDTAAAFGILVVPDDDLPTRLRTGRLWQRMHLWLTAHGMAAQPMNQVHERADREAQLGAAPTFTDELARLVERPGRTGLFTFRVGHPTGSAPASPRRAASDVTRCAAMRR